MQLISFLFPSVPEKPEVGLVLSTKLPPDPLTMLQLPVPIVGVFAASVVDVSPHIPEPVWSGPALAVVGDCSNVIVTLSVEDVQGEFAIVHFNT